MRALVIGFLMLCLPLALAEETAGVTPDSAFYGLDRAMESIATAMTFGKAAKAEKRLVHAEERLAEVQAMIDKDKLEHAEKAERLHEEKVDDAEKDVDDIETGDKPEETQDALEKTAKVQDKAESHYQKVTEVKDAILAKMQANNATPEKLARITAIFDRIKAKALEIETKADTKKNETKEKIKQQGKDPEAAEDEADKESGLEEGRKTRADKEIKNAEAALKKAKDKLSAEGESTESLDDAQETLDEAKAGKDQKKLKEVAEEVKEFGNSVSVIATQLHLAKADGTFDQVKEQLLLQIETNHREHMAAALADAPAESQTKIQERINAWEAKQAMPRFEVNSFEDCVAAGNPVMESYPRQCNAGNKTWTERLRNETDSTHGNQSTDGRGNETGGQGSHVCTDAEKAAEACTMEYMPVCGDNDVTYGNGCSACSSKLIESYRQGECRGKANGIGSE